MPRLYASEIGSISLCEILRCGVKFSLIIEIRWGILLCGRCRPRGLRFGSLHGGSLTDRRSTPKNDQRRTANGSRGAQVNFELGGVSKDYSRR